MIEYDEELKEANTEELESFGLIVEDWIESPVNV